MLDEADQIGQRRVVLGDHRCAGLATAADHEVDLIALEAVHAAAEGGRRFRRAGRVAGGLELQEGMDVVEQVLAHLLQVAADRSEEHKPELKSLMRTSSAVFCLKKQTLYSNQHQ